MRKIFFIIFSFIVFLTSCATPSTKRMEVDPVLVAKEKKKQKEVAFRNYVADYRRVLGVGYKIKKYSAPLCPNNNGSSVGFVLANKFSFNDYFSEEAQSILGLEEKLRVVQVFKDSGAASSGILENDIILEIDGAKAPTGRLANKEFTEKISDFQNGKKIVSLKILRRGVNRKVSIRLDTICDFPIIISENDAVNAFADGKQIIITRGMLRFTKNNKELALIIGHELAHNVMGHIDSKTINAIPGFLLDLAVGILGGINTQGLFTKLTSNAYSQEFEAEADYVGMYMMARAGLKLEGAPNFWRRMASIHPSNIENNLMASHPATPERFLALEQTITEINGKLMRGELLIPEKKN